MIRSLTFALAGMDNPFSMRSSHGAQEFEVFRKKKSNTVFLSGNRLLLLSLNDFGLGCSGSAPVTRVLKNTSNFFLESPFMVPPSVQMREKRNKHCSQRTICDCCIVGWPSLPESLIPSIIQVYRLRKEFTRWRGDVLIKRWHSCRI